MRKVVGIDLFCGIGGLTHGLFRSGIKIVAGFDNDPKCKVSFSQALNGNPEFVCTDLRTIAREDIIKYFPKDCYRLVAGCAPCQPYSMYQKKKSFTERAKLNSYGLIKEYLKIVKWVKPHFVVMENVPNLQNDPIFQTEFLNFFEKDYKFVYKVVNIADYGAPQNRKRLLFLAISKKIAKNKDKNKELEILSKLPSIKNKNSVFKAIHNLAPIKSGERDKKDFWHVCSRLSELNLKRIKHSKPGGTWRDWPDALLPECYQRQTGKTFSAVYGRINPNKPAPTLTTQFNRYGSGRYGHYEQNRALSIREGAILQTFPKEYKFDKENGVTIVARQIGNAVPPIVAKEVGKKIMDFIG